MIPQNCFLRQHLGKSGIFENLDLAFKRMDRLNGFFLLLDLAEPKGQKEIVSTDILNYLSINILQSI